MANFNEDLKSALGDPQIDVELYEKATGQNIEDDYDKIKKRTLRIIRTYLPCEHIVRKSVPSSTGQFGEGYVDVSDDEFMAITDVYVIKSKEFTSNVLFPWSVIRLREKLLVGASDFLATDLVILKNQIHALNSATDNIFSWKPYLGEGKVYVTNIPTDAIGVGIVGLKGITDLDDMEDTMLEYELALKYAIGLGKQKIGTFMRKFRVEGMEMPGIDMISEGKEEEKEAFEMIEENAVYTGGLSS